MQQVHAQYADTFGSMELGTRFELRAFDLPNVTLPTIAAPQATNGNDAKTVRTTGTITQQDRVNNGGIIADLRNREAGLQNATRADQIINGVTSRGVYNAQLGNDLIFKQHKLGATPEAMLQAVSGEIAVDGKNFSSGSSGRTFQDLAADLNGTDAGKSQAASDELARRYSAGLELRGDLDLAVTIGMQAKADLITQGKAADSPEAKEIQAKIDAATKQRDQLTGSLTNLRETIEGSKDHQYALGNLAMGQLTSGQKAPDGSVADQRTNQQLAKLPAGITQIDPAKNGGLQFGMTVEKNGTIWNALDKFNLSEADHAKAANEIVKARGGNDVVSAGDVVALPQWVVDKVAKADDSPAIGNTNGDATINNELSWLDQWMPVGPSKTSGWQAGKSLQDHWGMLSGDQGKANIQRIYNAIGDDPNKRGCFVDFVNRLYKMNGKADGFDWKGAGIDIAKAGGAGGGATGDTNTLVGQAVRHAMDAQGHLAIGQTVYTGNNYDDAANQLASNIKRLTDGGTQPQAAIDEVLSHVRSTASGDAASITMQNLKKELYAAYGVKAATDRASGNGLADAVNDFNDGPGNAMWSGTGNVKDAAALRAGDTDKRAAELAQLKGKSRDEVTQYVRSHYFVHHDGGWSSQQQDPAETPLQNQLIDAVCQQLGIK